MQKWGAKLRLAVMAGSFSSWRARCSSGRDICTWTQKKNKLNMLKNRQVMKTIICQSCFRPKCFAVLVTCELKKTHPRLTPGTESRAWRLARRLVFFVCQQLRRYSQLIQAFHTVTNRVCCIYSRRRRCRQLPRQCKKNKTPLRLSLTWGDGAIRAQTVNKSEKSRARAPRYSHRASHRLPPTTKREKSRAVATYLRETTRGAHFEGRSMNKNPCGARSFSQSPSFAFHMKTSSVTPTARFSSSSSSLSSPRLPSVSSNYTSLTTKTTINAFHIAGLIKKPWCDVMFFQGLPGEF